MIKRSRLVKTHFLDRIWSIQIQKIILNINIKAPTPQINRWITFATLLTVTISSDIFFSEKEYFFIYSPTFPYSCTICICYVFESADGKESKYNFSTLDWYTYTFMSSKIRRQLKLFSISIAEVLRRKIQYNLPF